jgi:hypothetical protein
MLVFLVVGLLIFNLGLTPTIEYGIVQTSKCAYIKTLGHIPIPLLKNRDKNVGAP